MPDDSRNLPVVVRKMGRPPGWGSLYSPEVAEEIVDRMCAGETLTMIVKTDRDGYLRAPGTFPSCRTIYDWADPNSVCPQPDFVAQFARAQLTRERVLIEMTRDIANTPLEGIEETLDIHPKFGVTMKRVKKDMLGHRKLQIDTIHQFLSKTNPQLWAERLQQATRADDDGTQQDKLIIEGGLPNNEPPPPPVTPADPADEE